MIPNGKTLLFRSFFKMTHAQNSRLFFIFKCRHYIPFFSIFYFLSEDVRITCCLTKITVIFCFSISDGFVLFKVLIHTLLFLHSFQRQSPQNCNHPFHIFCMTMFCYHKDSLLFYEAENNKLLGHFILFLSLHRYYKNISLTFPFL